MEARLILEPYFDELQEKFIEAGLSRISETRLRCKLGLHDTPRHFGGCVEDGTVIYLAPELVEFPDDVVMGILAHELGHAADFLYPGEFLIRGDSVVRIKPDKYRLQGWRKRSDDDIEIAADYIAQYVLGVPVGYRGPCHLQSLGLEGRPRPLGLR